VDATVIPHVEQRLNFSLGCYGCREATDMDPVESVLGFPGAALGALVAALERLNEKAVGRSRAKAALHGLDRRASFQHRESTTTPRVQPQSRCR
jgi:hypothetical protein